MLTPYKQMLADKNRVACTNCKHLHQEKHDNGTEQTDHINYCKKSGKIILEMHIDVANIFKKCFEKAGVK